MFLGYKDVTHVQPRSARPGREVEEIQGEADGVFSHPREQRVREWRLEEVFGKLWEERKKRGSWASGHAGLLYFYKDG